MVLLFVGCVLKSELTAMNKEIHRMQLRLEQLKKYQEQLLSEMQRVSHLGESAGKSYQNSRNLAGLFDSVAQHRQQSRQLSTHRYSCLPRVCMRWLPSQDASQVSSAPFLCELAACPHATESASRCLSTSAPLDLCGCVLRRFRNVNSSS